MKISYKLDEDELEFIEELSNITGVDYEIHDNLFPMDSFMPLLKDLKYEIGKLQEKIEDYKENYKPITNKEQFSDYEDYRLEKGIID